MEKRINKLKRQPRFKKVSLIKRSLLLLAVITSCLATGLVYGKYVTKSAPVSNNARVAEFNVSVELYGFSPEEEPEHIIRLESGIGTEIYFFVTNHNEVPVRVELSGEPAGSNTSEEVNFKLEQSSVVLGPGEQNVVIAHVRAAKKNVLLETIQDLRLDVMVEQVD
ncbi:hypothetical protein M2139_000586 [Enterococcus sp. PF1-24]|uniref:hypothetical protein n=1 Tax=unclassified Enterococcus TaxID=2608891 RepID=UPI00247461B7|nr:MULTISPECIES: hypothetical protein [unclassified Enterococcus]MDH6363749.1 hypothetical protein [Enterococcus sp. PFB1-1]MDH6400705.1 hypothetical protein [Enterococcus sp. PF1-24]